MSDTPSKTVAELVEEVRTIDPSRAALWDYWGQDDSPRSIRDAFQAGWEAGMEHQSSAPETPVIRAQCPHCQSQALHL